MRLSMIGSSPTNVIVPPVSDGSRPTLFISSVKCSLMLNDFPYLWLCLDCCGHTDSFCLRCRTPPKKHGGGLESFFRAELAVTIALRSCPFRFVRSNSGALMFPVVCFLIFVRLLSPLLVLIVSLVCGGFHCFLLSKFISLSR